MKFLRGELLSLDWSNSLLRPDGEGLSSLPASEANGHTTRVDVEVKLNTTKGSDPLGPLNAGSLASVVDGARRCAIRGKGEAATAGATEGL